MTASVPPGPASGPDAPGTPPRHRAPGAPPRRLGVVDVGIRVVFYLGALAALLVVVGLGVAAIVDTGASRTWGSYTEVSCEGGTIRHGCQSRGTWVSDDGRDRLGDVGLDGSVSDEGTTRAYATPDALLGGDDIVHDGAWTWVGWVLPAGLLVALVVGVLRRAEAFGDLERLRSRRRRGEGGRGGDARDDDARGEDGRDDDAPGGPARLSPRRSRPGR